MMRWLKDKKKEKRTNSSSQNDGEAEDDYGFGKEKSVTKSPSSRRELPPTPATPEEKSPHIYEEIPDLPLCCMPDNETALLQSKFSKHKIGIISRESSYMTFKTGASDKDDISPYMVVPVDNEVRQTPTDFHRNGTPEVHCDVIVKDTHCEILLTRKPKVGVFRLDNSALSVAGENGGDRRNIRNNTHLCSRDWRASSEVNSTGNISSAFSATSSAFSSSSASKIHSGCASSSLTLGNVSEHYPLETSEKNTVGDTGEEGVITYSSASNFIPRSTKLIFNPLPGKNPCKEAFGVDLSDGLSGLAYSSVKDGDLGVSGISFTSTRDSGSKCVTYASIQPNDDTDASPESHVIYAAVQDQQLDDAKSKLHYSFDDQLQSQFNPKQSNFLPNQSNDNSGFGCATRTGIIRPGSPSNSSNGIYALVTFPTETKHYNTIADVMSSNCPENADYHADDFTPDSFGVIYSSVNESSDKKVCCLPSNGEISDVRKTAERVSNNSNINRICCDSDRIICTEIAGQTEMRSDQNGNRVTVHGNCAKRGQEFYRPSDHFGRNLEIEFCLCSDEHSSSCGCPDAKHNQDDDATSVAGALNDGPNSCSSCGRLIRQITYSESYSDETYEHIYSSRLLIRTGRRFSSPDITVSETSISEFQDIQNWRNPEFLSAFSRDDSWMSTRNSDIIPPPYSTATESDMINSVDDTPNFKERNPVDAVRLNNMKSSSIEHVHDHHKSGKHAGQIGSNVTPTSHGISSFISGSSTVPTVNHSPDLHTENNSVFDNSSVGISTLSQNADQIRSLESLVDPSRKRDASSIVESKNNAFVGLLSKFSRAKSTRSAKPVPSKISTQACAALGGNPQQCEVTKCDKDLEEIPEKNTKKLSKFFQRLSSKEPTKAASDCVISTETDAQSTFMLTDITSAGKTPALKTLSAGHCTLSTNSQKYSRDDEQGFALHRKKDVEGGVGNFNCSTENCEKRLGSQSHAFSTKYYTYLSDSGNVLSSLSDQMSLETASAPSKDAPSTAASDVSNAKPQFKTDSGDTCYEYDISTSSEGEQAGYEYFLSKVKKTLNLEHEAQHIAESGAVRRKRLCKRCKQEGLYSTIDDVEDGATGGEGFCPHLAAKLGDLHAIFEDLVVDQRAAILDCLTDFTANPYSIRGHGQDVYCRECGCEILTSDSESLTTVYSLLSQQFRMTSPNGQTLSCDSDDGTMADNSGESADDDCDQNADNNKIPYDDNSSGYDEPKGKKENIAQKSKRKERRDKRSASLAQAHVVSKEIGIQEITPSLTLTPKKQEGAASGSNFVAIPTETPINKQRLKDVKENASTFSDNHRKIVLKKNTSTLLSTHSTETAGLYFSHGTNSKDDNLDHSKICDISRSRTSLITDKVLQDIYAPLPSKALSLLTARNYSFPAGLSCTCGRGLQTSLATVTAHLAAEKTLTTPVGCIKRDCFLKPSSARLTHCNSDKKDGVVTVQRHFQRDGKNKTRTSEKHPYELVTKNDGDLATSSHQEQNKCAQMPLPHTTKHSDVLVLPAESMCMADNGSDHSQSENLYTDICDSSPSVELKTEVTNLTHTRKHILGLVALDLLPESTVDGDTTETLQSHKKQIQPKRSGVIEKMAKLFENNYGSINNNMPSSSKQMNLTDLPSKKNNRSIIKNILINKDISADESSFKTSQSCARENFISDIYESATNGLVSIPPSKRSLSGKTTCSLIRQDNLCGRSESSNLNFNENPVTPDKDPLTVSKPRRSSSGSRQCKEDVTKSTCINSDNECGRLKNNDSKSIREKAGKAKLLTSYLTESRMTKQRSPTPSTSSVSSSSSSKKRNGHTRHKVSKKSYLRKRSKHRSDRSKSGHGKEERTYYYFSSDFSDIDVVEVENSESHATCASTNTFHSKKLITCNKKRGVSSDNMLTNSLETATNSTSPPQSNKKTEGADSGSSCEQEIYSMPATSSDLISRKNANETGNSPQPSPEMAKLRKMKNADVYKSRKSNNKLLSDLIIRNYDMQVYGNI